MNTKTFFVFKAVSCLLACLLDESKVNRHMSKVRF
jgi:hypothetical protein